MPRSVSLTRLTRPTALAVALAVLAIVTSPGRAYTQVLYGSIVGNVQDGQGAQTPGVLLTATNTGTGLKVETTTYGSGAYTFRNLLPGTYELAASLNGFREYRQSNIAVTAGNPIRVNVVLVLGALNEVVQVVSETTPLPGLKSTVPLNRPVTYELPSVSTAGFATGCRFAASFFPIS